MTDAGARTPSDGDGLSAVKRELLARLRKGNAPVAASRIPRAPADGPARLSFSQERVWLTSQLAGDVPAFNLGGAVRLRLPVGPETLAAALADVAARHDSLRTTVEVVDGRPRPVVAAAVPVTVPLTDLSGTPDPADGIEDRIREVILRPYRLDTAPLWRVELIRLAADDHVLVIAAHHLITDAASIMFVLHELAFPDRRPALPVSYTDYAAWQRAEFDGGRHDAQSAFWRRKLAALPPPLELPTDRPRPPEPDYAGSTLVLTTPAATGEALRTLARAEDTTVYTVVLTALKVLLARQTGRTDIVVGTQVTGRSLPELQNLVGMFVNVVPVRTSLAPDATAGEGTTGTVGFREVLRRVRHNLAEAMAHQDVPFETLVRDLRGDADRSFPPLVQVACNMPVQDTDHPLGEEIPMPIAPGGSLLDLTVHVIPRPDASLEIQFEYASSLFDATTVERLAEQHRRLLAAVGTDPDVDWRTADLLGADARRDALAAGTGAPAARTELLPALVATQAAATPDATAVEAAAGRLTYAGLTAAADALADRLRAAGVRPGAVVALCLDRGLDLQVATLAAWRAGAAFLPLDTEHPPARWALLLDTAGAPAVVADPQRAEALRAVVPAGCAVVETADPAVPAGAGNPAGAATVGAAEEPAADAPAYVMFTSGSTGRPKGVVVTHGAIANRVVWSVHAQKLGPDDRVLAKTRVGFDAAVLEWYAPLVAGGTVVMAGPGLERDPAGLVRAVADTGATVLQLVPSVLRAMLDQPGWDRCTALRQVWSAGEPLDYALVRRLTDRLPVAVWNTYGPTECAIDVTAYAVPAGPRTGPVPIGGPVDGVRTLVLDPYGQPTPPGVPGELCVGGAAVGGGYLGQPDLTAERFVPDPYGPPGARVYRTGDQVRRRADGVLEFVGRVDDQIKVNGVRVEPAEVRAALADHPRVRQCVVVGHTGPDNTRRLVAYLVADGDVDTAELREFLRGRLPEAMVPGVYVPLPALPLTPNGKVDRAALPAPDLSTVGVTYVAPVTDAEKAVADAWADVLGVERVGLRDDFFALGGHSLQLGQLAVRLRERSGVEVSIRDLFAALTVRGHADLIAAAGGETPPPVVPVAGTGPLPLSFGQRRLWFLDKLNPDSIEYLTPVFVPVPGPADPDLVARTLGDLVARHEALRTRYVVVDGEPVQVIDPPGQVPLRVVDIPGEPTAAVFADDMSRGFDLEAGPVLRAVLARPAAGDAVLLLLIHHIACDGWSTAVLGREFAEIHAAHRAGRPADLPDLSLRYADFASWQLSWLSGEVLDRQLDHWRDRLAGLPTLELPTDRVRPAVRDPRGAAVAFEVPGAVAGPLLAAGRSRGASPFMTLLAAFGVLLSRYSGQRDLAVGSPVAGRPVPQSHDLVGVFINTLVLRLDLSGAPTFGELLDRVRATTMSAFAHQDLPFDRLVEEVRTDRDLSRNPLYDVLFDLHEDGHAGYVPTTGVQDAPLAARQDLGLIMRRHADGAVSGMLEYATALFDRPTVDRMIGHYLRLLEQVAADPDVAVADLELLTGAERDLLGAWNDTARPVPAATLPELLRRQAAATPDAPAVVFDGTTLTYAELDARTDRLAALLAARGAGPERFVAVAVPRSVELVVALVAVLKSGAAYVPVDPGYPADRIAYLLADAHAELLLTASVVVGVLPAVDTPVLVLDDPATAAALEAATATPTPPGPANPAYVIYTSGSTGRPKGVVVPHAGIVNRLLWMQDRYGLTADDRVLQKTPSSFDVSVWEFFWPLLTGATLVLARPEGHRDAAYLAGVIRDRGITTIHFVPSMLDAFLGHPGVADGAAPRRVICSGEALGPALRDRFFELFDTELHNLYGPTEASVDVTSWQCAPGRPGEPVPIGHPVWNTRLYVLDAELRPVPPGVPGELYLAGVQLARGYLRRPDLTAERFVPDPYVAGERMYRTGDVARFRADGAVEYVGRADHQLKIRGYRVEPAEIQAVLTAHPGVREAVVVAVDRDGDRQLVAYWTPAGDPGPDGAAPAGPDGDELTDHCWEHLPEPMIPQFWVRLDSLPLTENGKVDRKALPAPELSATALTGTETVAPRTVAEERIAEIWTELLGIEVGVHHNFFAVGGHSILAVRLISRIAEEFDVELPLRLVFERATIAALAQAVEDEIRAEIARLTDAEVAALSDDAAAPAAPTDPDPAAAPAQ
ncbi:amino acid adenylation domain-containing protein [Polymorphospora sp. NPDC050346]|uniref:amino acid adenylation domain-containing protein n=1 Tax=Polymorphospora sp. NPDC050346 TaxID=3155780 RepID=UPI0033FBCD7A